MRVISFFLRFLAVLAVVVGLIYGIGAKAWLTFGTYGFIRDAKEIPEFALNAGEYVKVCQNAPASSNSSQPIAFQLRFLDDRQYVVEVVCSVIEDSPIEIGTGSLWPFIRKAPGSSGFYYSLRNFQETAVTLAVLHERMAFTLGPEKVVQTLGKVAPPQGPEIKNTCIGFGYKCCSLDSQSGNGDIAGSHITDCAQSCYSACVSVPYFSAFVSDPFPTQKRTIVMDQSQLSVTFSYTVDSADEVVKTVQIDYGDGKTEESSAAVGVFTHEYVCTGPCSYSVKIKAIDADGKESRTTETTQYTIEKK